MHTQLNTIDRCFIDAQELLEATQNGRGQLSRKYSIFSNLQPVLTKSSDDEILSLLALAIWLARGEKNHRIPTVNREEVITMNMDNASLQVRAGSKTYFFDLKETKDKKPYLVITESNFKGEGKERERVSLVIFQEHVEEFSKAVSEMTAKIVAK